MFKSVAACALIRKHHLFVSVEKERMSGTKRPRSDGNAFFIDEICKALKNDVDLKDYAIGARRTIKLAYILKQHLNRDDEVYAIVKAIQMNELTKKVDELMEQMNDIQTAITDQTSCHDEISKEFYRAIVKN